ncbi:hypothetical protein [Actinoplanes regularis]|nr:hypothetical protein [Actinoplanes regularis]GIE85898.1 hypothetical protein Are01nite_23780 [Actinoplanes regularis]GLW35110.1 hypothetical protein Areg01_80460 [Actinoplanes regularis]
MMGTAAVGVVVAVIATTQGGASAASAGFSYTGVSPSPCGRALVSQSGDDTKVPLDITNDTAEPIGLAWRDFTGKRSQFRTIAAGDSVETSLTYRKHVWEVTDKAGKCLRLFVINTTATSASIVLN